MPRAMHDLATFVLLALIATLPLLFFGGIWLAIRHGPLSTALWRGERWYGFAAFVAIACFSAGFFGPMLLAPGANQGPMLGLFITGPLGVVAGVAWGVLRARARARRAG